jgi:hypothetical protein
VPTQNTPQKFENFPLTPQKYHRDQRKPTGVTPQKRLLSHPSEELIRRGGVDIKWNGPKEFAGFEEEEQENSDS